MEKLGRGVHVYEGDQSSQESVGRLVSRVLADGHRSDVLLNCGGTISSMETAAISSKSTISMM